MKRFYLPLLVGVFLSSCLGYKELPVEYDYSFKGNFKNYRTFDIMKSFNASDSTMMNEVIEKSIIARMKFLGYRQVAHRPHLIIGYRMFQDSLRFNGYNQPAIEEWMQTQHEEIDYNPQKFIMNTGTLLIQFYDRRQSRSVWQGYATTLYGSIDFNNNRDLKNAVISILDKYRFWAEGFLKAAANQEKEL